MYDPERNYCNQFVNAWKAQLGGYAKGSVCIRYITFSNRGFRLNNHQRLTILHDVQF
jgi:hypothetical protein